jgi:DNA-binding MarR family transcriptional regulator
MSRTEALRVIDDTLIRLRRLWNGKAAGPADRHGEVELSTVLVVDAIHRIRGEEDEVTVRAVGVRLDVAPSTASRLVDRAVEAGMVVRRSSEADSRRSSLALSDQGEKLLAAAGAFRLGYLSDVLDDWSAKDVDTFARLLDRFATAVHRRPPVADGRGRVRT